MEFIIAAANKASFAETLKAVCKKFKVSYSVEYSEKKVIYGNKYDNTEVRGYDAVVKIDEIEKLSETGFTYLGSIKDDMIITTHSSKFAQDKGFELSSLKEEIETFPCHECGKKTVRKIIHVFMEDATEEITVYGSGCAVKKFGVDLNRLMNKFSYIMEAMEEEYGDRGSRGYHYISSKSYLAVAYSEIIQHGFTSGSKAYNEGGSATSQEAFEVYNIVFEGYNDRTDWTANIKASYPGIMKEHAFDYELFASWVETYLADLDDNDFKFNMVSTFEIIQDGALVGKVLGYATYMVFKFWDENVRIKESQEAKETYNTDYTGIEVGDKLKKITVKVTNEFTFAGAYGDTNIYTLKDLETGHKYKWFTQQCLEGDVEYSINTCTVKSLEDDKKYGKAIVITRARPKEIEA